MKIRDLRVRPVCVPMQQPHQTATGIITESPLVLTDLITDENVTGHSIIFTYTRAALGPAADLVRNLAPLLLGETLAPLELEAKLSARFRLLGTQGLVGMALAAIDMAAWDALARSQRLSLIALLGSAPKPIPAYGAVGFDGPVQAAKVAEHWAKRGFKGIKAKIGYASARHDLEVVQAIRSAVGDGVAIMVDYNQLLTPTDAIERSRQLEDEGLTWIEEPTLANDFQGHASVAREIKTPIQCGENWWGPLDVRHAIEARASDYVMLEAMKIGGVTGWLRASAICAASGIRVSNHLWPEVSAQLLSITPTAHWLEYCDWWNAVLIDPLQIENGVTVPSSAPGSGISWNEAVISQF
jgi:mandelate racemase